MAEIVLTEKTRFADQYLTLNVDVNGKITEGIELTEKEYKDLALKGAGAPPGVSKEDWESNKVCAAGGVRNYGNGQRSLNLGEFVELADRFEFGIVRKDGLRQTLEILKSKVDFSKIAGLTITKTSADAWPDNLGIVSIANGILTTE
jgi:hypothetical protein